MKDFLTSGFLLSLVFNFLWVIALIGSEMKVWKKWVIGIMLITVCTFAFAEMFYLENKEWNNGNCVNCETPYQAISYFKGSMTYECPNCRYRCTK